jgi:hypothetical protein
MRQYISFLDPRKTALARGACSQVLSFYSRCTPTEIIVKFTADFNISSGDKIAVELAGFTSGLCDNEPGLSIEELVNKQIGSVHQR